MRSDTGYIASFKYNQIDNMKTSFFRFTSVFLLSLMMTACTTLNIKPKTPTLSVLSVVPVKMGITEQVLRFKLNAFNPNSFNLPLQSMQFTTRFSGIDVGQGMMSEAITLAPNSDNELSLDVTTDLSKVIKNMGDLFKAQSLNFDYELDGKMTVLNTGIGDGVGIPFVLTGNLLKRE